MNTQMQSVDTIIVGGGLAGLAAAAYLSKAGRSVMLFEQSQHLGGRAMTQTQGGFRFNLGPHALYKGGAAAEVLQELGVPFQGGTPVTNGYAIYQGKRYTFPYNPATLLRTGFLGVRAKFEMVGFLAKLPKIDPKTALGLAVDEWVPQQLQHPEAQQLLKAFIRLSTYAADSRSMSAAAALAQLQVGLSGVWYLDGGWQTLVDGIRSVATSGQLEILAQAKVTKIEPKQSGLQAVQLADGRQFFAANVIIAASPKVTSDLLADQPQTPVDQWMQAAQPIYAACLDVALSAFPYPKKTFALGIDQPLYLSVHSAVANLAPAIGAMIHVAKYLQTDDKTEATENRQELEQMLDLIKPGWRKSVVEARFLPHLTVSHAVTAVSSDVLIDRPGPAIPGLPNVYVVGDWVGSTGMLLDASLASARQAATLILERPTMAIPEMMLLAENSVIAA